MKTIHRPNHQLARDPILQPARVHAQDARRAQYGDDKSIYLLLTVTLQQEAARDTPAQINAIIIIKQVGEYMSKIANMADESDDIKRPCIRQFMEGCLNCVENIQLGHPFCIETNPNYNPVGCVIVLNKCLIEELDGILDCPQ